MITQFRPQRGWITKFSEFDGDLILIAARPVAPGSAEYDIKVLLSSNCHGFDDDVDLDLLLPSIIHRNRIKARIRAQVKRSFSQLDVSLLQSFLGKLLDTAVKGRKVVLPWGTSRAAGQAGSQPAAPHAGADTPLMQRSTQPVPRPASLMQLQLLGTEISCRLRPQQRRCESSLQRGQTAWTLDTL